MSSMCRWGRNAVNEGVGYVQPEGKREKITQGLVAITQAERTNCESYCENLI